MARRRRSRGPLEGRERLEYLRREAPNYFVLEPPVARDDESAEPGGWWFRPAFAQIRFGAFPDKASCEAEAMMWGSWCAEMTLTEEERGRGIA